MRSDNASNAVYYCLIQMNIINLGILAHIDAGKTSVTENLLFASGATEKCGRVDNGDTITDSMDIEKRRGITVRASTTSIIWNGVKCNIIDTPGHMDFIAEVERTFKMLDGAVLILSAKEGIQAQTKLLFNTLHKLQIPTIIFINKIDRAGVNLERLYLDIKANLSQDVLFMQTVTDGSVYPVCSQTYIKEEYKEFVCNHDDDILERYLSDSEISPADYWNTIIALVAKAKVYPVLHGSAMFNIGINELMDAITSFILPPESVSNRLSAYLYKIEHDPKGHKRSFLKIIDGSLRLRDVVRINDSEKSIKIKNLKTIYQGREINFDEVGANDIAIVEDMEDFRIGDYLGVKPCLIQGLSHQHPALKSSVRPDKPEERSKVISALNTLWIEDPSLSFSINSYSDELEISLYGLTQKEIIQTLLEERFSVKVHFDEIKTIYKERPVKKVNKIIQIEVPPNPYWATIGLTLEPLPLGTGLQIESDISYGYLNHSFQNAVFEGIRMSCQSGSLLPAEETLDEIFPAPEGAEHLGYGDVNPRVLSGTKDGDTVTLEVEGHFASRLPSGTLTLVDGEPVSFTTPLYTAAEAAAKECMDRAGEIIASYTDDPPVFEEKVITNLFCAETVTAGEKTYYVWNLYYGMRPDDISKVMFAGGMDGQNGWVNQSSSMGDPVLILSVDGDGGIALEAETWTGTLSEEGLTWEEYVVCGVHLGMEPMYGILNGWPRIETDFLTSMRDGHETWAMDWQDVTRTYLSRQYGVEADGDLASLRTFQADSGTQSHDQAMVVKAVCGASTAYLLLAHVRYYVPAWDTDMTFWQVCGVKWEPGAPAEAVLGRGI